MQLFWILLPDLLWGNNFCQHMWHDCFYPTRDCCCFVIIGGVQSPAWLTALGDWGSMFYASHSTFIVLWLHFCLGSVGACEGLTKPSVCGSAKWWKVLMSRSQWRTWTFPWELCEQPRKHGLLWPLYIFLWDSCMSIQDGMVMPREQWKRPKNVFEVTPISTSQYIMVLSEVS